MIRNGKGGNKTNKVGLKFEKESSIIDKFKEMDGYDVQIIKSTNTSYKIASIFYKNKLIANCYKAHGFYDFLNENEINWENIISKKILPDDTLYIIMRETFFIIECKYQEVSGSIDEKLQTCDFKKKQYQKLLKPLDLKVEYVYILSNFYKDEKYRDVLDYIESVNCHYKFNNIPLTWFGLPSN